MKKKILLSILLTVMLISPAMNAYAGYYEPVKAEIAVEINNGGKAVIIADVNCPIPETTELELSDGHIGKFDIYFDEVGIYTYAVKTVPDKRNLIFDDKVYTVTVYVNDDDGKLVPTVIAYTGESKYSSHTIQPGGQTYGPERLLFSNLKQEDTTPPGEATTDTPTADTPTTEDDAKTDRRNRNPKTGDDLKMEQYFAVAMIASAGLLVLSVIYLIDTEKAIKKKENE